MAYRQNSIDLDDILVPSSEWNFTEFGALKLAGDEALLGRPTDISTTSPVSIPGSYSWKTLAVSNSHALAITVDGKLYSWGKNTVGQLGLVTVWSSTTVNYYPAPAGTSDIFKTIAASTDAGGDGSSYAINIMGELFAWGLNDWGQLGVGSVVNRSNIGQVGALTNWKQVSAGQRFMAAINESNKLYVCGLNSDGQLGKGNITPYSSPVQVGTLSNWKKVSAGQTHMAAVKTDGTLWTWGSNESGQLGKGDITSRSSPVQVGSDTDWVDVAASSSETIAIKSTGTAWGWGANSFGELGLANYNSYSSPVQIGSDTNWIRAWVVSTRTYLMKSDNNVYSSGIGCGVSPDNWIHTLLYEQVLDMSASSTTVGHITYERPES